jgi:hypothetical protein
MAKEMALDELAGELDAFSAALESARGESGALTGTDKRKVVEAYERLISRMPHAFELNNERDRREPIIVDALLQQIPGVERLTIDKLYKAALSRLDALFSARPDEVAITAGIPVAIAEQVSAHVRAYRDGVDATVSAPDIAAELDRLAGLVGELRSVHAAFESAAAGWSDDARTQKKLLRRDRERALLGVIISLARIGAVDNIILIEKLPFARKLEVLDHYIEVGRRQNAPRRRNNPRESKDELHP